MTNEERRQALATARRKALEYALHADSHDYRKRGPENTSIIMADMWAHVAQAMKVGNAIETDGADGNGDVLTRGGDDYLVSHIR